ncbi:Fpg/Nei family DNA glycosylase [Agilicoccus flavus]|uniref:Fpg/Nei family DNA glycosylase n=1 Tax=Agilicoccus flavus TaxID=2775968 RepID=UPI001CF630C1|nr:DNA-formamidopyrimidine glycosylase family protein [Agilicoccus flavus]
MPELPEVESARAAIEQAALGRVIADVDDTDTYECRPHAPGQIRDALLGRTLTGAFRRGKAMWCETSGLPGDDAGGDAGEGPVLGIHLGMSGRVMITGPDGEQISGGDPPSGRYGLDADAPGRKAEWDRFTLTFEDGGALRLFDKRRLGRVRLDPDLDGIGPDAERIGAQEFAERVGRGSAPVKARLLDQAVLAGVGNLLADETLWQARLDPRRAAGELTADELDRLHDALGAATRSAIAQGGVHTGEFIAARKKAGTCPRCGAALDRATVGSRTTWFCPQEQV